MRAAAKNYEDVLVVAGINHYTALFDLLETGNGVTNRAQRLKFAATAFAECAHYDIAISEYFNQSTESDFFQVSVQSRHPLRYGENPHQKGAFYGNFDRYFEKENGKEISYNNLLDIESACSIIAEFTETTFAIIKHNNVCGIASCSTALEAWLKALAADPESAFGGILISNKAIDLTTAQQLNELFFEILIAPGFEKGVIDLLRTKKSRILLRQKDSLKSTKSFRNVMEGVLVQDVDTANFLQWQESGARPCTEAEHADLVFANLVCKHLKSNAIALVKDKQLIGKGCGQTSRIDSLRQAIDKAVKAGLPIDAAVLASDAFFPFDDCVSMAYEAGIRAVIQPGGSIRDNDTIDFCKKHDMALVLTGVRHFRH